MVKFVAVEESHARERSTSFDASNTRPMADRSRRICFLNSSTLASSSRRCSSTYLAAVTSSIICPLLRRFSWFMSASIRCLSAWAATLDLAPMMSKCEIRSAIHPATFARSLAYSSSPRARICLPLVITMENSRACTVQRKVLRSEEMQSSQIKLTQSSASLVSFMLFMVRLLLSMYSRDRCPNSVAKMKHV